MTRKDMGPRGRGVCLGLALNKVGGGGGERWFGGGTSIFNAKICTGFNSHE